MNHIRIILAALISFSISSCNGIQDKVDTAVEQKISDTFNSVDSELWNEVEREFFARLTDLGLFQQDSLDAFYDLMKLVQDEGYSDQYYIDQDTPELQVLIQKLETIGYSIEDESAHRFLHQITKPIVETHNYSSETDMIYWYSYYDPDSIPLSFDLSAAHMPVGLDRPNLKRKGLYKVILLFYFSRMINGVPQRKYP